jgi:arylsulfatase A-like enzyme
MELVVNTDLAPTFAELARAYAPLGLDGKSLVPLFDRGGIPLRDEVLIESPGEFITAPSDAVRTARWKYIHTRRKQGVTHELYDLEQDPFELTNLSLRPKYAALRAALEKKVAPLAASRPPEPERPAPSAKRPPGSKRPAKTSPPGASLVPRTKIPTEPAASPSGKRS